MYVHCIGPGTPVGALVKSATGNLREPLFLEHSLFLRAEGQLSLLQPLASGLTGLWCDLVTLCFLSCLLEIRLLVRYCEILG